MNTKENWQEESRKRIAGFPEDIRNAHKHCGNHRNELESSELCGCFYCLSTFEPKTIEEWLDEGDGTALCPQCGIDSVIGSASGYPITAEFLEQMYKYWFAETT